MVINLWLRVISASMHFKNLKKKLIKVVCRHVCHLPSIPWMEASNTLFWFFIKKEDCLAFYINETRSSGFITGKKRAACITLIKARADK